MDRRHEKVRVVDFSINWQLATDNWQHD